MNTDQPLNAPVWITYVASILTGWLVFLASSVLIAIAGALLIRSTFQPNLQFLSPAGITVGVIAIIGGLLLALLSGKLAQRRLARASRVATLLWAAVVLVLSILAMPAQFTFVVE